MNNLRPTLLLKRIPVKNFPTLIEIRDTLRNLGLTFSRYKSDPFIDHFEYRPYNGSKLYEYKFADNTQISQENIIGVSAEVAD